jgi:predicted ArsR family transcriptional regulator
VKSPPKETRGEIVAILKKSEGMTTGEIAKKLALHSMTVRQHLSILERDGYIQHSREKIGRGRPTYVYHLTKEAEERLFPSNYPRFTMGLLDALALIDGEDKVNQLLECQMEAKISANFRNVQGKSLAEKVQMLATFLNEEGYMVEVEETPTAYIFKEHNCALDSVAKKYRQLCYQELSLFRHVLNTLVERQCHIATGDQLCSYEVSKGNTL